jgi:hypothetical protein
MGFKKILGKVAEKIEDKAGDIKEAREERRKEREIKEEEFQKNEQKINDLLDKFEIPDFELLFEKVIGSKPTLEYEIDKDSGRETAKHPLRREYLDFVLDNIHDEELSYQQLKDFATRHKIIQPSFFGDESDIVGDVNEFENIINSIHRGFDPEKIKDEKEFQAQLAVFLKAKYPDKKVEREVRTKMGNEMDIVIDNKYVFELKVPTSRAVLRDLGAQLEEYQEEYPNICAVIADTSEIDDEVETGLTQNIKQYSDKYKVKFGIQTLVFEIGKRK